MSDIWISMREKKLTNTLTLMTDTLARVTAERDRLTAELKSLRDSGVELPEPCIYEGDNSPLYDAPTGYDESQLRDYGDRRAMAERERAARVCEDATKSI